MADEKPADDKAVPPFVTADTMMPGAAERAARQAESQTHPHSGLSISPGLMEVENSEVPMYGDGSKGSHVFGPGQMPVDPVAAGLDLSANPQTRAENRMVTRTGELAAGPRPTTYAGKPGDVKQAATPDHGMEPAKPDAEAAKGPAQNSAPPTAPIVPKT